MTLTELKKAVLLNVEGACAHLLPGGRRHSGYWHAGSLAGEAGSSLRVCLTGNKAGVWMEGDASGEAGDIVELWKRARGISIPDTIEQIRGWLGMGPSVRVESKKEYKVPKAKLKALPGPSAKILRNRCIDWDVASKAGVAEADRGNPAIAFQYFEPGVEGPQFVKYLDHAHNERGKKVISVEAGAKPLLFGMCSPLVEDHSGWIVITEGEIDALSWLMVGVPAVSVPFGAKCAGSSGVSPNAEWIENCYDFLAQFHTIFINMDMDGDGEKAKADLCKLLGIDRCRIVTLPKKDANECLVSGVLDKSLLDSAEYVKVDQMVCASDLADEAVAEIGSGTKMEDQGYRMLGWELFEFRFRFGEGESTAWTGYSGSGKSTLLYQCVAWFACVHGIKSFIGSYEEPSKKILKVMMHQAANGLIDPKDKVVTSALKEQLASNIYFHDAGTDGEHTYEGFFERAAYAIKRYGVRFVVLDSASCVNVNLDDIPSVEKFMKEATKFRKKYPESHLVIVFHPKKPGPKGENEPPLKADMKGSGFIGDLVHNVVTVFRRPEGSTNTDYDSKVIISKQKVGGKRPCIPLRYDGDSYRLYESWTDNQPYINIPQSTEGDIPI